MTSNFNFCSNLCWYRWSEKRHVNLVVDKETRAAVMMVVNQGSQRKSCWHGWEVNEWKHGKTRTTWFATDVFLTSQNSRHDQSRFKSLMVFRLEIYGIFPRPWNTPTAWIWFPVEHALSPAFRHSSHGRHRRKGWSRFFDIWTLGEKT